MVRFSGGQWWTPKNARAVARLPADARDLLWLEHRVGSNLLGAMILSPARLHEALHFAERKDDALSNESRARCAQPSEA